MEWIKSNEEEPLKEGKYFCYYNTKKQVLEFVNINPKNEHFLKNEYFEECMVKDLKFWMEEINSSLFIHSNENLFWLKEI